MKNRIILIVLIILLNIGIVNAFINNPFSILDVTSLKNVYIKVNFTNLEDKVCVQGGDCSLNSLTVTNLTTINNQQINVTGNVTADWFIGFIDFSWVQNWFNPLSNLFYNKTETDDRYIKTDGTNSPSATINFNNQNLINVNNLNVSSIFQNNNTVCDFSGNCNSSYISIINNTGDNRYWKLEGGNNATGNQNIDGAINLAKGKIKLKGNSTIFDFKNDTINVNEHSLCPSDFSIAGVFNGNIREPEELDYIRVIDSTPSGPPPVFWNGYDNVTLYPFEFKGVDYVRTFIELSTTDSFYDFDLISDNLTGYNNYYFYVVFRNETESCLMYPNNTLWGANDGYVRIGKKAKWNIYSNELPTGSATVDNILKRNNVMHIRETGYNKSAIELSNKGANFPLGLATNEITTSYVYFVGATDYLNYFRIKPNLVGFADGAVLDPEPYKVVVDIVAGNKRSASQLIFNVSKSEEDIDLADETGVFFFSNNVPTGQIYGSRIAFGLNSEVNNNNTVAIGNKAVANAENSVAIGFNVTNDEPNSVKIGTASVYIYADGRINATNRTDALSFYQDNKEVCDISGNCNSTYNILDNNSIKAYVDLQATNVNTSWKFNTSDIINMILTNYDTMINFVSSLNNGIIGNITIAYYNDSVLADRINLNKASTDIAIINNGTNIKDEVYAGMGANDTLTNNRIANVESEYWNKSDTDISLNGVTINLNDGYFIMNASQFIAINSVINFSTIDSYTVNCTQTWEDIINNPVILINCLETYGLVIKTKVNITDDLIVGGNINVTNDLFVGNDLRTNNIYMNGEYIHSSDDNDDTYIKTGRAYWQFFGDSVLLMTVQEAVQDRVIINPNGNQDVDFTHRASDGTYNIYSDGGTKNVGIGNIAPETKLVVDGNTTADNFCFTAGGCITSSVTSVQRIHLKTSLNYNLAQNVETLFAWDIEEYKDAGAYNHSTGIGNVTITVVEAGVYDIDANLMYENDVSSARNTPISYVKINDVEITSTRFASYDRGYSYGKYSSTTIGTTISLSANDNITIAVKPYNVDGTLNIQASDCEVIVKRVATESVTNTWRPDSGWTDNGATIELTTSTDSVGIGTSPAVKLDVNSAGVDQVARITSTDNLAYMQIADSNDQAFIGVGDTDTFFLGKTASVSTDNLIMDLSSGYVGLGVTPVTKLDVDSGTVDSIASFSSTDAIGRIQVEDNTDISYFISYAGTTSIGSQTTAVASNLNIQADGDVGIGIVAPASKLHIASTVFEDHLILDRTAHASVDDLIYLAPSFSGANTQLRINIGTGGSQMVIESNGNTGINNISPNHKLSVGGDIYTQGDILLGDTTSDTISSYGGFTGNPSANIGGTGDAAYFPEGIYSAKQNWLYGGIQMNNGGLSNAGAITATTLDTGQGANELYDMNQNVTTGDDVRFNSVYYGSENARIYASGDGVVITGDAGDPSGWFYDNEVYLGDGDDPIHIRGDVDQVDSIAIGGGYASTGVNIQADGDIFTSGNLYVDGTSNTTVSSGGVAQIIDSTGITYILPQ